MSTTSVSSRPGHTLGTLVGNDGYVGHCSCAWMGGIRSAVQLAYADQILHMRGVSVPVMSDLGDVHQPSVDSCPCCGLEIEADKLH